MSKSPGPLRRAIEQATEEYLHERKRESVQTVKAVRLTLIDDETPFDEVAALAEGWELEARVELDRNRLESALECFLEAERILIDRPGHRELLGRICLQVAQELNEAPSFLDMRNRYESRAIELLSGSEEYGHFAVELASRINDRVEDEGNPLEALTKYVAERDLLIGRLNKPKKRFRPRRLVDFERLNFVTLHALYTSLEVGTDAQLADAVIKAVEVTSAIDEPDHYFHIAETVLHLLDRPLLGIAPTLDRLAEKTETLAQASGEPTQLAHAHMVKALAYRERESGDEALSEMISAVAWAQRAQSTSRESLLMRDALRSDLDGMRAYAAELAIQVQSNELLAELIESARLQSLRADAKDILEDSREDLLALVNNARARLLDPVPVSVGGWSRLSAALGTDGGTVEAVSLDESIELVGGSAAWYWGSWAALGRCYWVLRSPGGVWHGGANDLKQHSEALEAVNNDLFVSTGMYGDIDAYESELSLAKSIGLAVLPLPLAELLIGLVEPATLVVAGGFVGNLPLAAAALPGAGDIRLVEKAVIHVLPPVVYALNTTTAGMSCGCSVKTTHKVGQTDQLPLNVRIGVLDPDGTLQYSRNFHVPMKRLLTTESRLREQSLGGPAPVPTWALPATRRNLLQSFAGQAAGEPGIFYYSGHVEQNVVADGPNTALRLSDGPFTAAKISEQPMVSHVLLAACASSGASGAGAGEWLGLAGSLLLAGARQVTATSWVIPDLPFTADFETNLIEEIRLSGNSAVSLRNVQLSALAKWRLKNDSLLSGNAALPRTWASFLAIGW